MTPERKLEIILLYTTDPFTETLGIAGYYGWIEGLMWDEVKIVTSGKE